MVRKLTTVVDYQKKSIAEICIDPLPRENCFNSLCINLTNKCNTWCKYCFQNSSNRETDYIRAKDIKRVLEFFVRYQRDGKKYLQLTGGEIFIHPDIFEIIQIALSFGYILRLQTNGLLFEQMSKKELKSLSSPRIIIKVSLDGWDPTTHEYYRAKGSFEKVINGIRQIREWNQNLGIKTCVHKLNLPEFWRMLDLCLELRVRIFSYNLLRKEGRAEDLEFEPINELDVAQKLLPYFNQRKYHYLLNGNNILKYYLAKSNIIPIQKTFYINYDGGIFPTQDCREEERIGSIFEKDLATQFNPKLLFDKFLVIPEDLYMYIKQNLFLGKEVRFNAPKAYQN